MRNGVGPWRGVEFGSALVTVTITVLLAPLPALAATNIAVDSTGDSGDLLPGDGVCESELDGCTLRAAISEANAMAAAAGEVLITVPAGTYTLSLVGTGENANATGDLDV